MYTESEIKAIKELLGEEVGEFCVKTKDWFIKSNPYKSSSEEPTHRMILDKNGNWEYEQLKGKDIVRDGVKYEVKDYGFIAVKYNFPNTKKGGYFKGELKAYAHINNVGWFTKQQRPYDVKLGINDTGLFVISCKFK